MINQLPHSITIHVVADHISAITRVRDLPLSNYSPSMVYPQMIYMYILSVWHLTLEWAL